MKTKIIFALFILICYSGFAQIDYDSTFGNNGVYVQDNVDFGGTDNIAFQGNDKIIGGSYFQDFNTGAFLRSLFRLNLDGTLDTSFANNGVFRDDASITVNFPGSLVVNDTGIYTVSSPIFPGSDRTDITITKLTPDGALDTTFGSGGYAAIPSPTGSDWTDGIDLKIDNNGNIIAGGRVGITATQEGAFIITKFSANGILDAEFGTNGMYIHSSTPGFEQSFIALLVNSDNSINIIGNLNEAATSESHATVIKLTPNGSIDTSFATNGIYTDTSVGSTFPSRATLLDNESILLYGLGSVNSDDSDDYRGFSSRISSDGVLDTSYGTNGYGDGYFGGSNVIINYSQMIPKEDHYILIGDALDLGSFTRSIIVTRLHSDGTFDTAYGTNGTSFFSAPSTNFKGIRGRNAISEGGDFYIACEIELSSDPFPSYPSIAKLVDASLSTNEFEIDHDNTSLFPNPVDKTSSLNFSSKDTKIGKLSIVNLFGQEVSRRSIDIQSGVNSIPLAQDISTLAKGVYFVHILLNNTLIQSIKFAK